MELFTVNADATDMKQVRYIQYSLIYSNPSQITHLGSANWAPFWHPSGKKIIFSSNHASMGFNFNLWLVDEDGNNTEKVRGLYSTQYQFFRSHLIPSSTLFQCTHLTARSSSSSAIATAAIRAISTSSLPIGWNMRQCRRRQCRRRLPMRLLWLCRKCLLLLF